MQPTSLKAYIEISGELGARQEAVYERLKLMKSATNLELSEAMGLYPNQITPRIKELREKGLVCEDIVRKCRVSGRTAISWKLVKNTLF